jgi:hypothetical protein
MLYKRLLQRVKLTFFLQALDSKDLASIGLSRQDHAGMHRLSVKYYRTCSALPYATTFLRAGKVKALP